MNILITGAFGFEGANLSKALSTAFKHHLIAVDLVQLVAQSPPVYPTGAEFKSGTTSSPSKMDPLPGFPGRNS